MKLLNLNKKLFFSLILFIFSTPLFSEDSVDIWNKENLNKKNNITKEKNFSKKKTLSKIKINTPPPKEIEVNTNVTKINKNLVYGIFDPNENNLTLDMWVNSEGTRIKDTIERINKITLSSFAEEIFINTLFTISKLPNQNMTDEEFINYKLDWLIKNNKDELIATFLNRNKEFPNKKKIIRYLVDKNIAKANLNEACQKITLISNDVKDSYLEQFKIICFIENNNHSEFNLPGILFNEDITPDIIGTDLAVMCIGKPVFKKLLYNKFSQAGFSFPSIVHHSSVYSDKAAFQEGVVIGPQCVVSPDVNNLKTF